MDRRHAGALAPVSLVLLTLLAPGLAQGQGGRGTVEDRLSRLERQVDSNTVLDLLQRVDGLQREVRELRGELEQQADAVADQNRRQKELFLDLDRRLKRQEPVAGGDATPGATAASPAKPPATPAKPPASPGVQPSPPPVDGPAAGTGTAAGTAARPAPAAPTPAPPPTAAPTATGAPAAGAGVPSAAGADPLKEQAAYQQAFNLLKEGRYDQATKAFTSFLKGYPTGPYSDNAQYWLGESYYVNRQFQPALGEFSKLLQSYPDSAKVSHAKLKLGLIYAETGETERAKKLLEEVVAKYPNTPQARLAQERLQKIR